MLVTVGEDEFRSIVRAKEDIVNARVDYVAPVMASIAAKWMGTLDSHAITLVIYLLGRTLAFGKAADRIPYREFVEGCKTDKDEVCFAPVRMSDNTLRKHLAWLAENDFLTVYSVRRQGTGPESQARMFELNCKKFLNTEELEERNCNLLKDFHHTVEAKIAAEKAQKGPCKPSGMHDKVIRPPQNLGSTPPLVWGGSSYNIHILSSRVKESIHDNSPASGTASSGGETPLLAEPKKPRVKVQRADSINAVVETVSTKHRSIADVRAVAAASGALTKANVQAMIDKYMSKWNPGLPRVVVTDKPMGPFKKRLREANVNIPEFLEYMVREWRALAVQNHVSRRRAMGQNVKGDALPDAPDFKAMSYRMPYFLACYSNYVARGTKPEQEDAKDKMIESLKHRVDALQQEKVVIGEVLRRKKLNSIATTTGRVSSATLVTSNVPKRPSPTIDAGDSIINDDWEPPEWEEKKSGWGSK